MSLETKTVFVGLSGGVDSSVAALRLIRDGYNVVGVFINVWHPDFLECNWEQERLDAMRVAAHLNIPFLTCDASDEYEHEVGQYFISEYKAGRTPNPDVMCNREIKFGAFMRFAKAHNADFIATGHYAKKQGTTSNFSLQRGVDNAKDQSYFLWTLAQEQLKFVLLPVGDSEKSLIRNEAKRAKLPTAIKKDSQGICFLGHVDIPEFLGHFATLEQGSVLAKDGTVIGMHEGAIAYTLGQRHGFIIQSDNTKRTPYYVVSKDLGTNTITVAEKPPELSAKDTITLHSCNWIKTSPSADDTVEAQFRYRQNPFQVEIVTCTSSEATLRVASEIERPARGQSCVLYKGSTCLGGGVIS